jgi:hypothetical protein
MLKVRVITRGMSGIPPLYKISNCRVSPGDTVVAWLAYLDGAGWLQFGNVTTGKYGPMVLQALAPLTGSSIEWITECPTGVQVVYGPADEMESSAVRSDLGGHHRNLFQRPNVVGDARDTTQPQLA